MKRVFELLLLVLILTCCEKKNINISKEMMQNLEYLSTNSNKVFVIYSEYLSEKYIKKAIVLDKNNTNKTVYLEIDKNIIRDKSGKVIINGNNYGQDFYAWKIEIENNTIYFHPYWNYGKSTTDPLIFNYNEKSDDFKKFEIDESQY